MSGCSQDTGESPAVTLRVWCRKVKHESSAGGNAGYRHGKIRPITALELPSISGHRAAEVTSLLHNQASALWIESHQPIPSTLG
jgi:hypothetical protein